MEDHVPSQESERSCIYVRGFDFAYVSTIFWLDVGTILTLWYFSFFIIFHLLILRGPSWWWSHGSWIYNYLYNQFLSPLKLRVWTHSLRGVLDTTLCDKVCQWLVTGWWFSRGTPVSCNNTDPHDITEILLIVALNNIILTPVSMIFWLVFFVFNYIPFIFFLF